MGSHAISACLLDGGLLRDVADATCAAAGVDAAECERAHASAEAMLGRLGFRGDGWLGWLVSTDPAGLGLRAHWTSWERSLSAPWYCRSRGDNCVVITITAPPKNSTSSSSSCSIQACTRPCTRPCWCELR